MSNDLIGAPKDETHWYTGLGIAESIADIASGVESENWVEAGIGAFGTAAEAAAWATDPFGQLIQYGVSWLMEHLQPLRDALDWLAGDPPQIEAYAETWRNVSTSVAATATTLLDKSRADTATWQGSTANAYRSYAAALAQAITDTAKTAELISYVVSIAGMLVAAVRELVRDLIAELVAILVERAWVWAAETATGVGAPAAQAQITALVAKWVGKVARVIAKLCRSLNNLKGLTDKLDEIWDLLTKAWRRFRDGKDTKPGLPTKDPITGPNAKPPHVAGDGTSPSSTTTPSGISKPDTPDTIKPSKDSDNTTVPSGGGGSGNKPPRGNGGPTSPGDDPEDPNPDSGDDGGSATPTSPPQPNPRLPSRAQGQWVDPQGRVVPLESGDDGPYYEMAREATFLMGLTRFNPLGTSNLARHVEIQFVMRMIDLGIQHAVIEVDRPVCGTETGKADRPDTCDKWLERILPPGWTLTVKDGSTPEGRRYVGN